ncbi:ABC transporter permease subunit [Paenibacillus sp. LMG 31458]|uniref:ABC transporter permease subunit n=1 Tax=Paenibacillus phytorum TaxID=2654977 RepID=A0ABX1Y9F3_9BACL|nr:carbohydrate ABC transporter permease [Paenibacillus phytorum]NOU77159.1 ABC transporter permease subunit [Paenibacillus phytorum]
MRSVKEAGVWIITIIFLIPLFLVLINAFKTPAEADLMNLRLPVHFQFGNFWTVIEKGHMIRAFRNSMIISLGSVLLTNVASAMGAYILSRRRTKANRALYFYFIIGLIAPLNMIPTIKVMQLLHVMNTFQGIILLYSALMIPFTVFLYYGFISSVPRDLDESAVIDGCGPWQLFFRILFPLLIPVSITALLINFMNAWNDFVIPLYVLNKTAYNPMTLAVYNFYGTYISSWNLVCASIVLTTLPIIIAYVIGQRYIISGMMSGAVKG